MSDIYGYNRTNTSFAQIASSEYAAVSLGSSGGSSLLQSFSAAYQRDLKPFFALGDPNIYWVSGFPQGQMSVERAVGKSGFFNGLSGSCGVLGAVNINASGGQACASGGGAGSVNFTGAVLSAVRLQMRAGQSEIIEGADMRFSSMG